jgi:hypothetical protein
MRVREHGRAELDCLGTRHTNDHGFALDRWKKAKASVNPTAFISFLLLNQSNIRLCS